MTDADQEIARAIREKAYAIWETCGRPDGQADEHWRQAEDYVHRRQRTGGDWGADDEERLIDGRADVNYPALLTKDVPGG